jgi:energy-coupling factor transporter ATP-binding protein EcfA2
MDKSLLEIFRQAYRNLDLFPLLTAKEIDAFRVEYGGDTLTRLEQAVDDAPEDGKIVFAGHRGCGKSTLLKQFANQMIRQGYFVVFFSIADMVDLSAVDHVNILYSIAIQLLSEATQSKIDIPSKIKDDILSWLATTRTQTETRNLTSEVEVGGDVLKFVTAKLKTESTFRDEIKRTYERNISQLVEKIDQLARCIRTANAAKPREVLVVIDDLDKLDWKLVEEIYKNNVNALFQPQIRIVFTIPIAAIRDIGLRTILQSAGSPIQLMEVTKFFKRGDRHTRQNPDEKKIAVFLHVLQKRFPQPWEALVEPETAHQMVLYSGGVLREMVRIARTCCAHCLLQIRSQPDRTDIQINDEILEAALRDLRNEFSTSLGKQRYDILAMTYRDTKPEEVNDAEFLLLLHGLYVLEYRNDVLWYDVHPIVVELLKRENLIIPETLEVWG